MGGKLNKQIIPFTQVPNCLLYDPNISFKAKGIWAYMNAKPDGWNFSADRIANETKEERKAILTGLKELSKNGYITAKKLKDGRIEYTLHWEVASSEEDNTPAPETKETPEPTCAKNEQVQEKIGDPVFRPRPFRKDFSSDEEFEKALYDWNKTS